MIAIAKVVNGSFEGVNYPNNKEKLYIDKEEMSAKNSITSLQIIRQKIGKK